MPGPGAFSGVALHGRIHGEIHLSYYRSTSGFPSWGAGTRRRCPDRLPSVLHYQIFGVPSEQRRPSAETWSPGHAAAAATPGAWSPITATARRPDRPNTH